MCVSTADEALVKCTANAAGKTWCALCMDAVRCRAYRTTFFLILFGCVVLTLIAYIARHLRLYFDDFMCLFALSISFAISLGKVFEMSKGSFMLGQFIYII